MSDPSTWPTTPPTEEGWYWWIDDGALAEPEVLHLVRYPTRDGLRVLLSYGDSVPITYRPGRWRPGKIIP
jgi:hypothetical protein